MTTDNHESAKVAIVTGAGHPDGIGAASAKACLLYTSDAADE